MALPSPDERTLVQEETLVSAPPRRPTLWPWLVAILVVAAGAIAAAYALTRESDEPPPAPPPVARVEVPLLTGLREEPARRRLAEAGLRGEATRRPSTAEPRGVVVAQDPADGTRVDKGILVTYVVSAGPPKVAVPEVVGLKEAAARERVERARLRARVARRPADEPPGTVLKQAPEPGTRIARRSVVTLTISAGKPKVEVPDVVGVAGADAVRTLQAAGFDVTVRTVAGGGPRGTVLAQSPPAGAKAPRGSEVALDVVAGGGQEPPSEATVPDVVGQPLASAADALARAGLRAYVRYVPAAEPLGTVVEQAKPPGTAVRSGDSVGVNVSSGPGRGNGRTAAVPDVTGMDAEAARRRLVAAGFETKSYEVAAEPSRAGTVLEHQPGGTAPKGALVLLYVGR